MSCFVFLAYDKHHATLLWAVVTTLVLVGGFLVARKRAPEIKQIAQADSEMEMILGWPNPRPRRSTSSSGAPRSRTRPDQRPTRPTLPSILPRVGGIPPRLAPNHFRFPLTKISLYHRMVSLLKVVEYELPDRQVVVHFGWPLSSWLDRLAVGVMVFNLMRLPRMFPQFEFDMHYFRRPQERPRLRRALPAPNPLERPGPASGPLP